MKPLMLRPPVSAVAVAAALLVASLALAAGACFIATGDEATAHQLVAAVETYREKEGRYPESLPALVPKYLPALPRQEPDAPLYRYKRTEDGFTFAYVEGFNAFVVYDPKTKSWERRN